MTIKVQWDIDPCDVGCDEEYSGYIVTSINTNDNTKEIWSITYTYNWGCGDGCCGDTRTDIAYVGQISEWLKQRLLEKLPDYKIQEYHWNC